VKAPRTLHRTGWGLWKRPGMLVLSIDFIRLVRLVSVRLIAHLVL